MAAEVGVSSGYWFAVGVGSEFVSGARVSRRNRTGSHQEQTGESDKQAGGNNVNGIYSTEMGLLGDGITIGISMGAVCPCAVSSPLTAKDNFGGGFQIYDDYVARCEIHLPTVSATGAIRRGAVRCGAGDVAPNWGSKPMLAR